MKYLYFVCLIYLTACGGGGGGGSSPEKMDTPKTVIYVGDSMAAYRHEKSGPAFWESLDIDCDCKNGRSLWDYGDLPDYDIIFLGLATNDFLSNIDINLYRLDLMQTIDNSTAKVICVEPMDTASRSAHEYRQAMRDICSLSVYPPDFGIYADHNDGLHVTSAMDYLYVDMLTSTGHFN